VLDPGELRERTIHARILSPKNCSEHRYTGSVPPVVQRSLVSDQVFRIVCEEILSGRYAPGEKLPTQRRLAEDLGVNMASVREAVKRLEQLRLVEVRHGDAMRVRDWRAHGGLDVIAHVLFRAGGLDRETLRALLEARRLMLAEAARLAAGRSNSEQSALLEALARRLADAEETEAAQALDWEFMSTLVDAAGNVVFALIMNSIRELYFARAELFAGVVADRAELAPLYRRAAAAVAAGSGARAAAAVAEIAQRQERRLEEALG
jgi:DNA-binding FadR family transcriptional regulator